jgi:hypothetical protein
MMLRILHEFEESLAEEAETLVQWRADVQMWEKSKTGSNPYESRISSTCLDLPKQE